MKKTFIALLTLAGVAAGADSTVTPVASITNYSVTSSGAISLSDTTSNWNAFYGKLDAKEGFTLQVTLSDWTCANAGGPLFYFSTEGVNNSSNATSIVTVGYTAGINNTDNPKWAGATLFNAANGSSTDARVSYKFSSTDAVVSTLPSHDSLSNGQLEDTVSLFVTGKGGTITLYEVSSSNQLVEVCSTTCLTEGIADSIVFSQWTTEAGKQNTNRATISMSAYSGVLEKEQMIALIPEPTTATLSLLALAGLAARRRRK